MRQHKFSANWMPNTTNAIASFPTPSLWFVEVFCCVLSIFFIIINIGVQTSLLVSQLIL
jgi:hypothetical protein